jgi:hypothetical protein
MNQLPSLHHSSQCFRLTTLDLKPTAADEGTLDGISGMLSRSEYLPTRIMADSSGRVRVMVENCSEGRGARGSLWGMKRMEGRFLLGALSAVVSVVAMLGEAGIGPEWLRIVNGGATESPRFLVIVGGGKREGRDGESGAVWERERVNWCVLAELVTAGEMGDASGGVVACAVAARGRFDLDGGVELDGGCACRLCV